MKENNTFSGPSSRLEVSTTIAEAPVCFSSTFIYTTYSYQFPPSKKNK